MDPDSILRLRRSRVLKNVQELGKTLSAEMQTIFFTILIIIHMHIYFDKLTNLLDEQTRRISLIISEVITFSLFTLYSTMPKTSHTSLSFE